MPGLPSRQMRTSMGVVALVLWITTAGFGLYLLSIWLIEYDKDFQAEAATRLPPVALVCHVMFAVGGLIVWGAYLFFDKDGLTWVAAAALAMAATLGLFMASRWIGVHRAERAHRAGQAALAGRSLASRESAPSAQGDRFDPAGLGAGFVEPAYLRPGLSGAGSRFPGQAAADLGRNEPGRNGRGRGRAGRSETGPPERNFPLPVVVGHGLFAFATITLVLLVAFGVGGG
jgi:hypothetical protein